MCSARNYRAHWLTRPEKKQNDLISTVSRRNMSAHVGAARRYWDRLHLLNRLTPDDSYTGRTAPLTSKICILYIYSTNIGTKYFKHALYSPFSSLKNAVCFIMLTCLVPVLFTFYIQGVLKLKKNNSGAKGLILYSINFRWLWMVWSIWSTN